MQDRIGVQGRKKLLLLDVDNTSFAYTNTFRDGISPRIIEEVQRVQHTPERYEGFIIVTHRHFASYDGWLRNPLQRVGIEHLRSVLHIGFTHQVINHLEQQTGLSCLVVSTLQDFLLRGKQECGWGYENQIKKVEKLLLTHYCQLGMDNVDRAEMIFEYFQQCATYSQCQIQWDTDYTSKNLQLLDVIAYLNRCYPAEKLDLTFIDDVMNICRNALLLTLPAGVTLSVCHHDAFSQSSIRRLGTVNAVNRAMLLETPMEMKETNSVHRLFTIKPGSKDDITLYPKSSNPSSFWQRKSRDDSCQAPVRLNFI